MTITPNQPFETDLRKRASPARSAAQWRRWASETGRQKEGRLKQILGLMFGLLALLSVGSPVAQTTYPEKPIRIVVGLPPGSQPDTVARLLGQKLTEALGKAVLIDNVTGAAGNIAADRVAKA